MSFDGISVAGLSPSSNTPLLDPTNIATFQDAAETGRELYGNLQNGDFAEAGNGVNHFADRLVKKLYEAGENPTVASLVDGISKLAYVGFALVAYQYFPVITALGIGVGFIFGEEFVGTEDEDQYTSRKLGAFTNIYELTRDMTLGVKDQESLGSRTLCIAALIIGNICLAPSSIGLWWGADAGARLRTVLTSPSQNSDKSTDVMEALQKFDLLGAAVRANNCLDVYVQQMVDYARDPRHAKSIELAQTVAYYAFAPIAAIYALPSTVLGGLIGFVAGDEFVGTEDEHEYSDLKLGALANYGDLITETLKAPRQDLGSRSLGLAGLIAANVLMAPGSIGLFWGAYGAAWLRSSPQPKTPSYSPIDTVNHTPIDLNYESKED